jgi:hypothetical protein
MPTRDEILKQLVDSNHEILARLDRIEQAQGGDPWLQDFDLDGTDTPAKPDAAPEPEFEKPERPADWALMTPEQREAWERVYGEAPLPPDINRAAPEIQTVQIGRGVGVQFPAPSAEAKAEWEEQAETVMENFKGDPQKGTLISQEDATKAYAIGGPLWLAAFDHDFIMSLPQVWRVEMVEQVTSYAPDHGQRLGRDLLRADTETARARAYDVAEKADMGEAGYDVQAVKDAERAARQA